jgi:Protein of unknown function (DUF3606)
MVGAAKVRWLGLDAVEAISFSFRGSGTTTFFPTLSCCLREPTMADDPSKRGPQDRSRINTDEDYEVRYWSQKFGVSPQQLKAAVRRVGNSAEAVERVLKASGALSA